jgi:hypothetical protein
MKTECLDHRSDFPALHIKGKSPIDHTNIICHLLAADRNFVTTLKIKLLLGKRWLMGGGNWPFEWKHSVSFNGSPSRAKNTFFQSPYSQICSLENKYYTEENAYKLVA